MSIREKAEAEIAEERLEELKARMRGKIQTLEEAEKTVERLESDIEQIEEEAEELEEKVGE